MSERGRQCCDAAGVGRRHPPPRHSGKRRHAGNAQKARDRCRRYRAVPHRAHVFEGDRIQAMRQMIMASMQQNAGQRSTTCCRCSRRISRHFRAMDGFPVTIRTLDPPLHEAAHRSDIEALARDTGITVEQVRNKTAALREANPMLGHRGCRLGISTRDHRYAGTRNLQCGSELPAHGITVHPES